MNGARLIWAFAVAVVAAAAHAGEPLPVASIVVEPQSGLEVMDSLVGRVVSARRSELGFERGGRVDTVVVAAGDRVVRGQKLAALDTRQLSAQRREAEARLRSARADLQRTRAQLDLAAATRQRQADLYERGVAAAQEHDEALYGERALRAQLGAAEAVIGAAEAALASIDVALELSVIEAPFDGVITRRDIHEGAVAGAGVPVLSLIDARREVRVGVPLPKRDQLRVGEPYPVEIEGRPREAVLRRLVDSVDGPTRTVEAIFDLSGDAVDGAVARLRLATRLEHEGFWLPATALSEGRRGLWSVLVLQPVDRGHRVERREVQLLHVEADRVYVRGPIAAGERVASAGIERVVPGQLVQAIDG